jgi:hypothetical protein
MLKTFKIICPDAQVWQVVYAHQCITADAPHNEIQCLAAGLSACLVEGCQHAGGGGRGIRQECRISAADSVPNSVQASRDVQVKLPLRRNEPHIKLKVDFFTIWFEVGGELRT